MHTKLMTLKKINSRINRIYENNLETLIPSAMNCFMNRSETT
jgi:hypothetical protein